MNNFPTSIWSGSCTGGPQQGQQSNCCPCPPSNSGELFLPRPSLKIALVRFPGLEARRHHAARQFAGTGRSIAQNTIFTTSCRNWG